MYIQIKIMQDLVSVRSVTVFRAGMYTGLTTRRIRSEFICFTCLDAVDFNL